VQLELFHNRFTAIAEEMGDTLQRTALSTNVKERLDYSCAIVDARGGLVSHAAHIPVHIGAMSQCVVCLMEELAGAGGVRPGAVYVSNDPFRGGSHLPDITVMTPVFDGLKGDLLFWTASRAHHAEIGGIVPGSMPPISCCLADEGVLIRAMRVGVSGQGAIDDDELRRALSSGPFPSRAVEQNIADLHAQIAANHRGAVLLNELVGRHGEGVVQAYMTHIQQAAAAKMRSALRGISNGVYQFRDELDDGWPIAVTLTVRDGEAVVDFSGTGPVHPGNFNATPAIVVSAVLYCLRCLIQDDIPLNAGVLEPVRIVIPPGLLDSPSNPDATLCPAVAAGNVETSQRIVDVVLGALGVAAASQGTMNNLAFGDDQFGYYETIGGGAGAGPTWDGASAVHTHMTNTRLTDPEVLEARYPVRLRRFSVRRGSRGAGARFGGDGIVREIAFLAPLNVSLVTQRRGRAPFGLKGGNAASAGRNLLMRKTVVETGAIDDRTEVLPAAWNGDVGAGDVIRIETPGGGGFGHPVARRDTLQEHSGSFRRPDRTILSCSMR
jgi:5-oxoprolinase (ATP-hydrolysing)